jgi:predicted permease
MRLLDLLGLRVRSLLRSGDVDTAMKNEMRVHLEEQIDENIAAGMTPADARQAAVRAFGRLDAVEEQCRDTRRVAFVEHVAQDLRYSFRSLLAQPMLVGASLASIAVAIGANTTIFSLATSLMFALPTAREPERLVHIRMGSGSHVSHQQWRDLSESGALAGLTGFDVETTINWRNGDESTTVVPLIVAANFFDVLATPMAMGRGFTAGEAQAERDPAVAVLSHGFWERALGRDPDVVGRTLVFNGRPYTVLGVLPEGLRSIVGFGLAPEVYVPLSRSLAPDIDNLDDGAVQLVGRLRDGQSVEEGRAAIATVGTRLESKYGRRNFGRVDQFSPAGSTDQLGSLTAVAMFFAVLLVAVGLVLAIACANVAGLLLARATARSREIAVRIALGASRRRVVQQLLTEGFWIAVGGTALGLLLMRTLFVLLGRLSLPIPLPLELRADLDWRLLAYTLTLTLATTILCALAPALQATQRAQWPALRQGATGGTRRWSLRNALVVGQIAVALVLLVTASLFVRNLSHAARLDPGFDTSNTMVGLIGFVEGRYSDERRTAWLEQAADRARALPGVVAAGYAYGAPLTVRNGMSVGTDLTLESTGSKFHAGYQTNFVGPGFFQALGITVVAGREFRSDDRRGTPEVAIVSQAFVQQYLGTIAPIGQRIRLPGPDGTTYPAEIVGVVGDAQFRSLGEAPRPAVYEPYAQRSRGQRVAHVFVRTVPGASLAAKDVSRALSELDPLTAVEARSMYDALAFAFLPSRLGAGLLGALGLLGLLLAMAGLFAVVSYAVSRRTSEIGIRMALGASSSRVVRLVVRDAAAVTTVGVVLGLTAAWLVTQPLAMFLIEGVQGDAVAFAGATLLLLLVSLVAALGPARRAVRIDPASALRCE